MRFARPSRLDFGIFLISFAVLLLEMLLTRIFSVTMYYHLSFLVVSLAMLGLGASGLVVNLFASRFSPDRIWRQTAVGATLFAVASVIAVGVAFNTHVDIEESWKALSLLYALCLVPFLSGGLVVALILTHNPERANRLYFFDLLGAALGCLLFIPATNVLGAPTAVLTAAAIAALSAMVLAGRDALGARTAAGIVGVLLAATAIANLRFGFYDVRVVKGHEQAPVLAIRWNSFSRTEVDGRPEDLTTPKRPSSAGYSTELPDDVTIPELLLRYDGDAATQVTGFDGNLDKVTYLSYDVTAAAYQIRTYSNVLIIGAGGGRDVLTALTNGSGPVTGVEINPLTIDLMRGQFREFTGGLYNDAPGVRIVNDDGRSFVRHGGQQFELIQASLVDTWAASSAGAYALTENSLYTSDAMDDFLDHLAPDGVISFTRWYGHPPVESLRVVTIASDALRRQGVADPSRNVMVVRSNDPASPYVPVCTMLIKKSAFTASEIAALNAWAADKKFVTVYAPGQTAPEGEPTYFHELLGPQSHKFFSEFPYDISAVDDNRPFFFDRVPLAAWLGHQLGIVESRVGSSPLTLGSKMLLVALALTFACTVLLLVLPLVAGRWRAPDAEHSGVSRGRGFLWALYFTGLGLGFIMVEIVLIQQFNLFLGYPVYSLSVVLFTMLLASSIGSLLAGNYRQAITLPRALGVLCAMLIVYVVGLPPMLDAMLGASTPVRILVAATLVAPLGLCMGMPFPTGLRLAGRESSGLVSWAWAVNGGASVFGSTLTVLVSMTFGFSASFVAGALAYAASLGVAIWLTRPGTAVEEAPLVVEAVGG